MVGSKAWITVHGLTFCQALLAKEMGDAILEPGEIKVVAKVILLYLYVFETRCLWDADGWGSEQESVGVVHHPRVFCSLR